MAGPPRDQERETQIEQQLALKAPGLVEDFRAARVAYDAQNYVEAERRLMLVYAAQSDFDPAVWRLGATQAMLGRREAGIELVEKAVRLNRTSENLATLAHVLASGTAATSADQNRALALLMECATLPRGSDGYILGLTAQLQLQLGEIGPARETLDTLKRRFPDLIQTHSLAAWLAATDEKWGQAVREIRRAEQLGLDEKSVHQFLDSGVQARATGWFIAGLAAWAVGLWAAGLAALAGLGIVLSKATLRQIENSDPTAPIALREQTLRRLYRGLLNVAGLYYYISLPVVFVVIIAATAGMIFGFLMIGFLPIKLLMILGIGAIATIVAMVRSLFIRVKASDPGRLLRVAEAPGLWELTRDVARAMDTRPVDEIRITVGTDLCVYERGRWREKLENRATRVLVIGAAVLDGFKQEDFRSVLAHEYGHFSNRDTAGGDIAMRVQTDMLAFYHAMVNAGQATWLNLGFHFLRIYHFIFRRIAHGATRLQEVLADRVAAQHYGAFAFECGLRHAIRRSLDFAATANREIEMAIKDRRPLQNLYGGTTAKDTTVEDAFREAMTRATTNDDTHPSPKDRFRLVAKIPSPNRPPSTGLVWDLFTDRPALLSEMVALVEKSIERHRANGEV